MYKGLNAQGDRGAKNCRMNEGNISVLPHIQPAPNTSLMQGTGQGSEPADVQAITTINAHEGNSILFTWLYEIIFDTNHSVQTPLLALPIFIAFFFLVFQLVFFSHFS